MDATKKIFLSGKITDRPKDQYTSEFHEAEMIWMLKGYNVINPVTLPHDHDRTYHSYMKACICELIKCDAIVMIGKWYTSRGAMIEYRLAKDLGMEIIIKK